MANLRWKVIVVLAVLLVFATVGVYPMLERYGAPMPAWLKTRALKLGLDLKGGVHLVLRVQTDDALRVATEQEMERFRERLTTAKVATTNIAVTSPTEFKIEGVKPDQEGGFRDVANEASPDFERSAVGGGTYTFVMRPSVQQTLRDRRVIGYELILITRYGRRIAVSFNAGVFTDAAGSATPLPWPSICARPARARISA